MVFTKSLIHFSDQARPETREATDKPPIKAAKLISPVEVCETSKARKHQTAEALSDEVVPSDDELDVFVDLARYEWISLCF